MRNLGCLIEGNTGRAIIEADTGTVYSYEDFDNMCNSDAHMLVEKGLKKNDRIAIAADNSARYLSLFLGALRAGIGVVTIDNKLSVERQKELSDFSSCSLFFDNSSLKQPQSYTGKHNGIPVDVSPDTVDRIQFTSGSTGKPKAVVRTHAADNYLADYQVWSEPGKIEIHATNFHFARGMNQLIRTIRWGTTIILLKKFTPKSFVNAISKYNVTVIDAPPVMHRLIMQIIEKRNIDVSFVKEIQTSADTVTLKLVNQINRVYNNPKFINRWASSELTSPFIHGSNKTYDLGFLHPESKSKLVDGEFWYKGALTFKEYLNSPEETADKFEDGWFKTNDIMRVDEDGRYWYLGRKDDTFKVSAKLVYPQEITRIIEEHPAVKQSICIPLPDKLRGNKVVVYILLEDNKKETIYTKNDMVAWFKTRSKGIEHCIPRKYIFVDKFPLNGPGKINRKKLIEMAEVS